MIQIPVTLRFWDKDPTQATATIQEQGSSQRTLRAVAKLGLFWALAVVSVVIPLARFILVPGFLIYGVIAARKSFQEDRILISVHGVCPSCREKQEFKPGGRFQPGRTLECCNCRKDLVLEASS